MAGGAGFRAAVPDVHSAQRLYAHSPFWLPEQPNPATKTGGYPALLIAAAQTSSDTGEPGVSAVLALPPL